MRSVIWLSGMPRSGTTWVSQFFAASPQVRVKFCPLFSYTFKNALSEGASSADWAEFFTKVYRTPDPFMDQQHLLKDGLIPQSKVKLPDPPWLLIKSNRQHHLTDALLEKMPEIRYLALVRDPRDAIRSWLHNPAEFPAGASPAREWRYGLARKTGVGEFWGFDDWKKVTSMHLRLTEKYGERFKLYRYEEIRENPVLVAKRMFDELGVPWSDHVSDFIKASSQGGNVSYRSVYRDSNRPEPPANRALPRGVEDEIVNDLRGTELQQFLHS